jgi:hypothetical protein
MEALKRDPGEHTCARAAGVGVCGEIRAFVSEFKRGLIHFGNGKGV